MEKLENILRNTSKNNFNAENLTQSIDLESTFFQESKDFEEINQAKFKKEAIRQASGIYIENLMKEIENPPKKEEIIKIDEKLKDEKKIAKKKKAGERIQKVKENESRRESLKRSIIISDNFEQYDRIYKMYKEDLRKMKFNVEEEDSDDENSPTIKLNSCEILQRSNFLIIFLKFNKKIVLLKISKKSLKN